MFTSSVTKTTTWYTPSQQVNVQVDVKYGRVSVAQTDQKESVVDQDKVDIVLNAVDKECQQSGIVLTSEDLLKIRETVISRLKLKL